MCQCSSHRHSPVSEPAIARLLPAHCGHKQASGISAAAGNHPHPGPERRCRAHRDGRLVGLPHPRPDRPEAAVPARRTRHRRRSRRSRFLASAGHGPGRVAQATGGRPVYVRTRSERACRGADLGNWPVSPQGRSSRPPAGRSGHRRVPRSSRLLHRRRTRCSRRCCAPRGSCSPCAARSTPSCWSARLLGTWWGERSPASPERAAADLEELIGEGLVEYAAEHEQPGGAGAAVRHRLPGHPGAGRRRPSGPRSS